MIPHLSEASGKAHCKICKQKISKGERCICFLWDVFYQHASVAYLHKSCLSAKLRTDNEFMGRSA